MDKKTIEKVKRLIDKTAKNYELDLEEVIFFGSRAREDYRERSDVDILIVSENFEGMAWNKRPGPFYEEWNYDELPEPEFICLTPQEFNEKKKRKPNLVRTAVEEGVRVEV